jgi:hypothetical protein
MRILPMIGLFIFAVLAWSLFQLVMGVLGIDHYFGVFGALLALIAAFFFRFTLPLSVGAFFGMTEVLGWHWFIALLVCMPGLLLLVPGFIAARLEPYDLKYDPFARYRKSSGGSNPMGNAGPRDSSVIEGDYEVVDEKEKKD